MVNYWSLLFGSRGFLRTGFCVIAVLLSAVLDLLAPMVFGRAIDGIQSAMSLEQLIWQAAVIFAVKGAGSLMYAVSAYLATVTAVHVVTTLRAQYYANVLRQSPDFLNKFHPTDLVWRAVGDLEVIAKMIDEALPFTLRTLFSVSIAIPLVFRLSRGIAFLLLLIFPLVVGLTFLIHIRTRKYGERIQQARTMLLQHLDETITGIKTIRTYCLENSRSATFEKLVEAHSETVLRMVRVSSFFGPLTFLLVGLCFMVNTVYGVVLVSNDQLTLGQFVEINGYMWQFLWPLTSLGGVIGIFRLSRLGFQRLTEVLTKTPMNKLPAKTPESDVSHGHVVFDHVTVQYEDLEEPVLKDINLVIKGGQVAAIIGNSGSGKSTMMRLLLRNCDLSKGNVFIDDLPVQDYDLTRLRSRISYVTQEPFLFSGTIADNIGLGKALASRSEIRQAAEIAGLLDDINAFPDGFETRVGERGSTLSGGQKQRLAIARAILRDPKILILDDSLSSVDARTEEKILAYLLTTGRDRTTIIISNHIRSIKNAEMIYLLEDGGIREQGSHSELIARGGEYAKLCETEPKSRSMA